MASKSFNLVTEGWIPAAGGNPVSLAAIFANEELKALGGDARQKIAVLKLLLAIAQAAATPEDTAAWAQMGAEGMASKCAAYLEKWQSAFDLYGEKPFLQMPVQKAEEKPYGSIMPEIALGNNPLFMHLQCSRQLDDAGKAMLLLLQMSMSLGGKKGDKNVSLAPNYAKGAALKPGPGLGYNGMLHTFLTGSNMRETIWLNLLTRNEIARMAQFTDGLGVPPWEEMPQSEICPTAERLKNSFMGRLIPLSRFCLLAEDGLHLTEGIIHRDYKEGMWDISTAARQDKKDAKMLWADPEKRPWRFLTALLSFMASESAANGFQCLQIKCGMEKLQETSIGAFGIWSGALRVSSNAGEQYVSGGDDQVESEIVLKMDMLHNSDWYPELSRKMQWLDQLAKTVYGCVIGYYRENGAEGDKLARQASGVFWEGAEAIFPDLVDACDCKDDMPEVEKRCTRLVLDVYDEFCPQDTARQICAWAKCRPRLRAAGQVERPASGICSAGVERNAGDARAVKETAPKADNPREKKAGKKAPKAVDTEEHKAELKTPMRRQPLPGITLQESSQPAALEQGTLF